MYFKNCHKKTLKFSAAFMFVFVLVVFMEKLFVAGIWITPQFLVRAQWRAAFHFQFTGREIRKIFKDNIIGDGILVPVII
jgi:hypothetical protein